MYTHEALDEFYYHEEIRPTVWSSDGAILDSTSIQVNIILNNTIIFLLLRYRTSEEVFMRKRTKQFPIQLTQKMHENFVHITV